MPSEDNKVLEFNLYHKSDKEPFIISVDLQCLIEKIDGFKHIHEKLPKTKVSEHIPSGFPVSAISLFKIRENKLDVCREYAMEIILKRKK